MPKMTIRNCMDAALQLVNQYSITGTVVPLSYNDQADTENRMLNLINDAQMQIATTVKPISAFLDFVVPEDPEHYEDLIFDIPDNYNYMVALTFRPLTGRDLRSVDASVYKWIGDEKLLLPSYPAGTYTLEYNRFPVRYAPGTDPDTELDNTPDTHEAIPYFVAAMLAVDENPKAYYANYNIWETRLSRLGMKPAHAVSTKVLDVYNFGGML